MLGAMFDAVGERRRVTLEDDEVRHHRLQLGQFDARVLAAVPIVEISKLSFRRLLDLERSAGIVLEWCDVQWRGYGYAMERIPPPLHADSHSSASGFDICCGIKVAHFVQRRPPVRERGLSESAQLERC